MRLAFLVCMALSPLSLLPMLLLPRLPTVMTKFSFRVSHTVLLWLCVMIMLRFLSRALVFLAFTLLEFHLVAAGPAMHATASQTLVAARWRMEILHMLSLLLSTKRMSVQALGLWANAGAKLAWLHLGE
jgi:hypothetical protein